MAQHNLSPADKARLAINKMVSERDKLLALLIVIIQKMDNNIVITHAELAGVDPNIQLQQTDPTEIGFKLTTQRLPPT